MHCAGKVGVAGGHSLSNSDLLAQRVRAGSLLWKNVNSSHTLAQGLCLDLLQRVDGN